MLSHSTSRKLFLAEYNVRSNLQKVSDSLHLIFKEPPHSYKKSKKFPFLPAVPGYQGRWRSYWLQGITRVHALRGRAAVTGVVISYICASTNLARYYTFMGKEQQYVFFKLSSEKQNPGLAYIDKQTSCTASESKLVLVHLHTLIILGCRYRINPEVWHQAISRCSLTYWDEHIICFCHHGFY